MKCKKDSCTNLAITGNQFCSRSCSTSYTNSKRILSDITKNKISNSRKGQIPSTKLEKVERICQECKINYLTKPYLKLKFCSNSCKNIHSGRIRGKSSKQGKRSKNEISFANLCKDYFDEVLLNEPIFNGWDADIILPKNKIAILWNGKWHYEKITKSHSLEQVQNRDKLKIFEIQRAGYFAYIIKDMGRENSQFVQKEFEKFIISLEKIK